MLDRLAGIILPIIERILNKRGVIVLCEDNIQAQEIKSLIETISPFFSDADISALILPYDEYEPFTNIMPVAELLIRKIEGLSELIGNNRYNVVIVPVKGLISYTIPIEVLKRYIIELRLDDRVSIKSLIERLTAAGYIREGVVDMKGRFSLRGEILDVFGMNKRFPARIVFFGDRIERIRYFDIETQRGFKDVDIYKILPINEFILSDEFRNNTIENIKYVASENGFPSNLLKEYIEELDLSFSLNLKNHYLPFMYNYRCNSVFDYIKHHFGDMGGVDILSTSKETLIEELEEYYELIYSNFEDLKKGEKIYPPLDSLIVDKSQVISFVDKSVTESKGVEVPDTERMLSKVRLYLKKDTNISLEHIKLELNELMRSYSRIVFVYKSDRERDIMAEMLNLMGVRFTAEFDEGVGVFLTPGEMRSAIAIEGSLFIPVSFLAREKRIYEYEESVYDKIRAIRLKFNEIKVGDYVVHQDFGIGIYRGLKKISSEGGVQDFIIIEYKDNKLLYLPALNIDLISKYEARSGKSPAISSLGKDEWQKRKVKIKEEILRFAAEILRLRAERKMIKKIPIKEPDEMYERFVEGFEYIETKDQLRCIEEVKRDLMSDFPMERIICGDVGFGKTEIIMRAAFMVAGSGYQVAILVPTTVLAEQHYHNFKRRFYEFPFRIEMLSRFVSPSEQVRIINDIREGKVDIVIGTHKILMGNLEFKNLRLLVIDEEQKFGVEQKELLKKQFPDLDILITTATPIPRTLHMGFSGLLDLSVLSTPPEGRVPIRTVLSRYDDEVIRNAIYKEIKRYGQVFFVHPRIQGIETEAKRVASLISGLRVAVVHGRMASDTIENVMHDFYEKKYDVLVSTNIIGSGLDFQNVNTIIVNRADMFGLAELYQLRGRVGRGRVNGYAYFLFPSLTNVPPEIKKKMDVLYRHQGLGAGFNIASEDLEMRGAGELLGKKQAGFIDGIGFDLYQELLEDAICEIKGVEPRRRIEPEIRLDMPVYIPDSYIEDVVVRLNFYYRFSMARDEVAIEELLGELQDRFGEYPEEVRNLARLSEIKAMARKMGIRGIYQHRQSFSFLFDSSINISPEKIISFLQTYSGLARITPDSKLYIKNEESIDVFVFLREWLNRLRELIE